MVQYFTVQVCQTNQMMQRRFVHVFEVSKKWNAVTAMFMYYKMIKEFRASSL